MARLYKRGNIWYLDYFDKTGKRHRESTETGNRQKAEAIRLQRETDLRDGKFGIERPEKLTFEEFKEEFLEFCKDKKLNTYKYYTYMLLPLGKYFADTLLEDITPHRIEQYKARRLQEKVSKTTVKRELSALSYFFKQAVLWKKAAVNPMGEVEKPDEPKGRFRYGTLDEIERLLAQCKIPYLKMIVEIALHTGMRKGEILGLMKERVDLVNNLFCVDESMSSGTRGTPKSGKFREIPINDYLLPLITEWMNNTPGEHLFTVQDIKGSFNSAVERAGIKNFTFHDLRLRLSPGYGRRGHCDSK